MLTWEEFFATAKAGTKFEFYPATAKDFSMSPDLGKQMGKVCTVTADPNTDLWCVLFEDSNGTEWCFYTSNFNDRRATFRII